MAADAWLVHNKAKRYIMDGTMNLETQAYKCALFLSSQTNAHLAATAELAGAGSEITTGGYTAGGVAVDLLLSDATVKTTVSCANISWTASSTSLVARFAVIYNNTLVSTPNKPILCSCALETTDLTTTITNQLIIVIHANGLFSLE